MKAIIHKPPHGGTIQAIASKSHAHRALIAAALADTNTEIVCHDVNADILATVRCLQALGARVTRHDGSFSVSPLQRSVINTARCLDVGESGSTLRFMLPVACALGINVSYTMGGRLPLRPLSPLYEKLVSHGCTLSPQGSTPLTSSGQLAGGTFCIAGNISSQFITGLLLALPLLPNDSRIEVIGSLESKPYVDITLQVLRDFGITVQEEENAYRIPGGQIYHSPGTLTIEGDWSNAACWLAIGAIGMHPVTVTGLNTQSPQGDKAILSLLTRFGANISHTKDSITVSGGSLRGIAINAAATPDLVPVIAAVALSAREQTHIYNAARLRLKECDRLSAIAQTLDAFGAQITQTEDGLFLTYNKGLHGATISSQNDHRIVMMAALVSIVCDGDIIIENADAVNKSYPRFFEDFRRLGGQIREVQA